MTRRNRASPGAAHRKESPREKMLRLGPRALSESELFAVLLGSGSPGIRLSDHRIATKEDATVGLS
ncbi:MAG: hypothetical protein D6679_13660 [Candidatus Hydrogenedentota bacterium]|nr:MAG: hypothetical protein D6679_13660 [Candidatus Hydrogenedentota bacterium]